MVHCTIQPSTFGKCVCFLLFCDYLSSGSQKDKNMDQVQTTRQKRCIDVIKKIISTNLRLAFEFLFTPGHIRTFYFCAKIYLPRTSRCEIRFSKKRRSPFENFNFQADLRVKCKLLTIIERNLCPILFTRTIPTSTCIKIENRLPRESFIVTIIYYMPKYFIFIPNNYFYISFASIIVPFPPYVVIVTCLIVKSSKIDQYKIFIFKHITYSK